MKTFKDIGAFKRRVQKTADWDNRIKIAGRRYTLCKQGETISMCVTHDYALFYNKQLGEMIRINYHGQRTQEKDDAKAIERPYYFIDIEFKDYAKAY